MKPTLLILAAGLGSRYGGVKQMDKVGPSGESIIDYSIYDAIRTGFGKVVFVINKKIENDFKEIFEPKLKGKIKTEYVLQEIDDLPEGYSVPENRIKPWGTAHAIMAARNVIHEPFAVINADDFYGRNSYQALVDFFSLKNRDEKEFCMVGFKLEKTITESGTVSRGVCSLDESKCLTEVVEHTKIQKDGKNIIFINEDGLSKEISTETIVSMNFWGFSPLLFKSLHEGFKEFLKQNINDPKSEYFIPTVITDMINANAASVKVLESTEQWFGVTYQEDKPMVIENVKKLVEWGVYPENLWG